MLTAITLQTPVSTALDQFLAQPGRGPSTKQKIKNKLKTFLNTHGNTPLAEITPQTLDVWFNHLENRCGYSNGHLAFHRNAHRVFFRWCSQFTGKNPAQNIKRYPDAPSRIITANENDLKRAIQICEQQMWTDLCSQRDAAIFVLGSVGMRRSNIGAMRYSEAMHALNAPMQSKNADDVFYVLQTGGKRQMEGILDKRRAEILKRYTINRPRTKHDRLFINLNPNSPHYLMPLSSEGLKRARNRVCKQANIPLISFQKMRRLIGTRIAIAHGVAVAAHVLGHTAGVETILRHYYNPDSETARHAVLDVLAD